MKNDGIWTRVKLFAATEEQYWHHIEARFSSQDHAELLARVEKFFEDANTLGKLDPVDVEIEQINWDCHIDADKPWVTINSFSTEVKDFAEFKKWLGI